jgi:hypothetical protein
MLKKKRKKKEEKNRVQIKKPIFEKKNEMQIANDLLQVENDAPDGIRNLGFEGEIKNIIMFFINAFFT